MLSKKLKEMRINKGLTQSELSKISSVSISYIQQIERGVKENPSLEILEKLSDSLNTSVNILISEPEDLNVGNTIQKYRIKSGLSREEVSKLTAIPLDTYINYEEGRIVPNIGVLSLITNILNVPSGTEFHDLVDEHIEKRKSLLYHFSRFCLLCGIDLNYNFSDTETDEFITNTRDYIEYLMYKYNKESEANGKGSREEES